MKMAILVYDRNRKNNNVNRFTIINSSKYEYWERCYIMRRRKYSIQYQREDSGYPDLIPSIPKNMSVPEDVYKELEITFHVDVDFPEEVKQKAEENLKSLRSVLQKYGY